MQLRPVAPTVCQVATTFAAEVIGMPTRGDVGLGLMAELISLLHRYSALVVPAGRVDPADMVAFSRRIGLLKSATGSAIPVRSHAVSAADVPDDCGWQRSGPVDLMLYMAVLTNH